MNGWSQACRHFKPYFATPSMTSSSSSLVHADRLAQSSASGIDPPPENLESKSARPSRRFLSAMSLDSVQAFCSRCHRLRTASSERLGSSAAIRFHCVPKWATAADMSLSSACPHASFLFWPVRLAGSCISAGSDSRRSPAGTITCWTAVKLSLPLVDIADLGASTILQ